VLADHSPLLLLLLSLTIKLMLVKIPLFFLLPQRARQLICLVLECPVRLGVSTTLGF
jgi:hypothetical protein